MEHSVRKATHCVSIHIIRILFALQETTSHLIVTVTNKCMRRSGPKLYDLIGQLFQLMDLLGLQ